VAAVQHASSRAAARLRSAWSTPERRRDALVVLLTVVTGMTDAVGFVRLGGVFTSVMTGNMVLLGIAAARRTAPLALHTGVAFVGYVAGSIAGASIARRPEPSDGTWPARVTTALLAEIALFAAFAGGFEAAHGKPTGVAAAALLSCNAAALGIQSSAVLRFGVSGLSSTYLTGTLTNLLAGLVHSPRGAWRGGRNLALLAGLVVGAALGASLCVRAAWSEPVVQLGLVLAVVAASAAWFRERAPSQAGRAELARR